MSKAVAEQYPNSPPGPFDGTELSEAARKPSRMEALSARISETLNASLSNERALDLALSRLRGEMPEPDHSEVNTQSGPKSGILGDMEDCVDHIDRSHARLSSKLCELQQLVGG